MLVRDQQKPGINRTGCLRSAACVLFSRSIRILFDWRAIVPRDSTVGGDLMNLKSESLGPILILGIFVLVPLSHGDDIFFSQISYDVSGVALGAVPDIPTFRETNSIAGFGEDPITAQAADSVLAGGFDSGYADLTSASFSAHAKPGNLGVDPRAGGVNKLDGSAHSYKCGGAGNR